MSDYKLIAQSSSFTHNSSREASGLKLTDIAMVFVLSAIGFFLALTFLETGCSLSISLSNLCQYMDVQNINAPEIGLRH